VVWEGVRDGIVQPIKLAILEYGGELRFIMFHPGDLFSRKFGCCRNWFLGIRCGQPTVYLACKLVYLFKARVQYTFLSDLRVLIRL